MRHAWYAAGAYIAIALAITFPLALGLGRDVAYDLGDSVLVMWVISWDCEQFLTILHGHGRAALHFFDANIFHPAPLALAYSEHMTASALQALPIYAATHNPILCYNLLFLSSFVLCGLGAYLFVRELTGDELAAFAGGLLFAFAPYRIAQSSHLQVLSAQWMPFALYGFRRYFDSVTSRSAARPRGGRLLPLAGAAIALTLEQLSSTYYIVYFTPFAMGYVFWEIGRRRMWSNVRMWVQLAAAGLATIVVTMPFLLPYLALRDAFDFARARGEVIRYSADVYSYATALNVQPLWGSIASAWPKPEAELFPGVVALVLALVGIVGGCKGLPSGAASSVDAAPFVNRPFTGRVVRWLLAFAVVLHLVAFVVVLLGRRVTLDLDLFVVHMSNANQLLLRGAIAFGLLCAVSPRVRHRAAAMMRSHGFFVAALVAAAWLSLGPQPESLGRPLELFAPYRVLYDHVPGFDAVRVPARYGTIVVLMLAVLGGLGAAVLTRRRITRVLLAPLALLFLAEGAVVPFAVNGVQQPYGLATPEARLHRPGRAPTSYAHVAMLPRDAVLAELPLGDPEYDRRAMFYSIVHWRPILNGYSGFYPPHYGELSLAVSDVPGHSAIALDAMRRLGATHVLVHESAYLNGIGEKTSAALAAAGAREVFRDGGDILMQLPR